ncbi:hypothetical protein TNCV_4353811 [Trichonephila clavipes]|nr:hypothetical protein TNCV_4353811 [Trichonephila clavipes]
MAKTALISLSLLNLLQKTRIKPKLASPPLQTTTPHQSEEVSTSTDLMCIDLIYMGHQDYPRLSREKFMAINTR